MGLRPLVILASLFFSIQFAYADYPATWWQPVPKEEASSWEILPQDAKPGEVILSKRNELGIFSNLSYSPFILDDVLYNSVEGLWQGMKYPDPALENDPRSNVSWPHTRAEVYLMSSWDSKNAGNAANDIYDQNKFKFISYKDRQFKTGSSYHLEIITNAIREKVKQNPQIKELLLQTKGLVLKPDHFISDRESPSHKYHEILMKIRDEL